MQIPELNESMRTLIEEHDEEPGWEGLPEWDSQGFHEGSMAPTPLCQEAWRRAFGEEPTPRNVIGFIQDIPDGSADAAAVEAEHDLNVSMHPEEDEDR